jgi:hypothetical protein
MAFSAAAPSAAIVVFAFAPESNATPRHNPHPSHFNV